MEVIKVLGKCPFTGLMISLVRGQSCDSNGETLHQGTRLFLRRADDLYMSHYLGNDIHVWYVNPYYHRGHQNYSGAMVVYRNYMKYAREFLSESSNWLVEGF